MVVHLRLKNKNNRNNKGKTMNANETLLTIPLGFTARDRISGIQGTAIARTQWLNGCWRIMIQPRQLKDGRPVDSCSFDYQQVELIEVGQEAPTEKPKGPGGPMPEPSQGFE